MTAYPRYPGAAFKPLGPETEPAITPKVLIFHTMVGGLRGSYDMFAANGYSGVESTFLVGGPSDGAILDGAVWQAQDIGYQADAQFAGNEYGTSIETSDGGHPDVPWSPKQLAALIALGAWWCKVTGNPPVLVSQPTGKGIGYHAQFSVWNETNHSCPGAVRIAQLKSVVIPGIAKALAPKPAPKPTPKPTPKPNPYAAYMKVVLGKGDTGSAVVALQKGLKITADGDFGPATEAAVKAFQKAHMLQSDGVVGPATWAALVAAL